MKKSTAKNVKTDTVAHTADVNKVIADNETPKKESKVTVNKDAMKKAVSKPNETIGLAPTADGKNGFETKSVEPGISVVCNINGLNVGDECHIECAPNPKRPGSKAHSRYEAYAKSSTVKEYLDNGGLKADLRYDHNKGYLTVLEVIREGKLVILETK